MEEDICDLSQSHHTHVAFFFQMFSHARTCCCCLIFFFFFSHFYFPASGHAVVTSVVPSPPRFLPSIFIAHKVQRPHCSSMFHRVLLTHALAFSASQFVPKKKSPRIYTNMHSGGFELTKLTYTRLKDNLIRHQGDWLHILRGDHQPLPRDNHLF